MSGMLQQWQNQVNAVNRLRLQIALIKPTDSLVEVSLLVLPS